MNENFTLDNLKKQRVGSQFRIVHLATHAEFVPGNRKILIFIWETRN
nr:hypothetical protein [[Phormidium] sp. ETS-05]